MPSSVWLAAVPATMLSVTVASYAVLVPVFWTVRVNVSVSPGTARRVSSSAVWPLTSLSMVSVGSMTSVLSVAGPASLS